MRGIPSTPASKIFSGFSNEPKKFQRNITKRAGGAMLIDISDLPQAPNMKKRRGPAAPKPSKSEADPENGPKKRGGGRKPKDQEQGKNKSFCYFNGVKKKSLSNLEFKVFS